MKINCYNCLEFKNSVDFTCRPNVFIIREAVNFYLLLPAFYKYGLQKFIALCNDCLFWDYSLDGIHYEGDENSDYSAVLMYLPITKEEAIKIALLS